MTTRQPLDVTCPRCGAVPGDPCLMYGAKPERWGEFHSYRRSAAALPPRGELLAPQPPTEPEEAPMTEPEEIDTFDRWGIEHSPQCPRPEPTVRRGTEDWNLMVCPLCRAQRITRRGVVEEVAR